MLNMFGKIKKMFSSRKDEIESQKPSFFDNLYQKTTNISSKIINHFKNLVDEMFIMRQKFKNLLETNMKLGFWHIEKGNISDAIFRFRFIKKFWPNHFEAYYQLAYCLVLKDKKTEARKILEELLQKNPDFDKKAIILLKKISEN